MSPSDSITEVVGEPVPDLSALDENAAYYVKNPKMRGSVEKPRWFMVDMEFRKKLSKPVKYVGHHLFPYKLLTNMF